MSDEARKPKLEVVEENISIAKPGGFSLDKFKSKRAPAAANVETLQPALPHHTIAAAKDFVRLHPDETRYWSPELCFVNVPIRGQKRDTLHLIEDVIAMRFLPSGRVLRFRLALASKPGNVFFLCHLPTRNEDNPWNVTNVAACEMAKTLWVQATSRKEEGVEGRPHDRPRGSSGIAAPDRCQAADLMSDNFTTINICDFEYEIADGDLPHVLCMVAYVLDENLRHVRTIHMWREELLASTCPPFDTGPDALFVAYSAWAEMTCFMALPWKFPVHIFDLHTAYLAASNVLLPHDPTMGASACSNIARRTFAHQQHYCASNCAAAKDCRRRTSSACCIGLITAPRRLPKYKPAACRLTCRCGTSCRRTRQQ